MTRQYFRDARGRFASAARFEWAMRETGAFRPLLTVEPSRPDIPVLTDAVRLAHAPFWQRLDRWDIAWLIPAALFGLTAIIAIVSLL